RTDMPPRFEGRRPPWMETTACAPDDLSERALRNIQPRYSIHEAGSLRSALASIPADIDGKTWFSIGAALHDLKWHIEGSDVGFEIWDEWSKTSTGKGPGKGEYRGRADLERRWRSFGREYEGPRTTIATIYDLAKR